MIKDIQENIYGHKKKMNFILKAVRDYSETRSKDFSEIKVLDFGCGNGTAVSYPLANLGAELTGVDFHPGVIKFVNANNRFPNAKFILGNEDSVLKLGEHFDVIVYSDIIEHLPDAEAVLKKLGSVHKTGGIIIVSIPNGYGPFEIEKFITKWTGLEFAVIRAFNLPSKIKKWIFRKQVKHKGGSLAYNTKSPHRQFFRLKTFHNLLRNTEYVPFKFRKGAFLGAPVSEKFLGFKKFIEWNVKIADKLSPRLVSTWYFVCEKDGSGGDHV